MFAPRWHKVWQDLWRNKVRSLLVILSIALGVFAVGMVSSANVILQGDMKITYAAIHPAQVILDISPLTPEDLPEAQDLPGVSQVEGRYLAMGANLVRPPQELLSVDILAASDWNQAAIEQLLLLEGSFPERGEAVIEHRGLTQAKVTVGDLLRVEMPEGTLCELRISGIVQDLNVGAGDLNTNIYITLETLELLNLPRRYNRLYLTALPDPVDLTALGKQIEIELLHRNIQTFRITTRAIGQTPVDIFVTGILGILALLVVLALALSGLLITNTITALLTQHIRQIGIMKSVGARLSQILGMYVALLLSYGGLAFGIAILPALYAGYGLSDALARLLNARILEFRTIPGAVLLMALVSLAIPMLSGFLPVLRGVQMTIREAMNAQDLVNTSTIITQESPLLQVGFISRPLLLSLRGLGRRKARLSLTLLSLIMAGAIFMAVVSVRASLIDFFAPLMKFVTADINLAFDAPTPRQVVEPISRQVPNIAYIEPWEMISSNLLSADGQVVLDHFDILAVPNQSRVLQQPEATEGRWLQEGDQNAVVLSSAVTSRHPELHVGDPLTLEIDGRKLAFTIVGKFAFVDTDTTKFIFTSYEYLSQRQGETDRASLYRVLLTKDSPQAQTQASTALRQALKQRGYTAALTTGEVIRNGISSGIDGIVTFLMVMAILVALVGGVGLAGTMSLNVMERTREIGVMRSIGATNSAIFSMIIVEGALVGLVSWLAAILLAWPLGKLMSDNMGIILFQKPMSYSFSWQGMLTWLGLVLLLSSAASLQPALWATRITIRDAISYE